MLLARMIHQTFILCACWKCNFTEADKVVFKGKLQETKVPSGEKR